VELGRTLWRLGDKDRALTELEAAMDLDVEDINAHLQKVSPAGYPAVAVLPC
jgi:hypothetical protein